MTRQVIPHRGITRVDFDLLDAGVALDVDQTADGEQVVVQLVTSTDVERRMAITVKRAQPREVQTRHAWLAPVPPGETPPAGKSVFVGQSRKHTGGVRNVLRDGECLRIVGIAGAVLDIPHLMAEPLEADNVVQMLPDHSGHRAGAHETEDDNFFAAHDS